YSRRCKWLLLKAVYHFVLKEPSSLMRGTIPLELVDASTVRSSQRRHGIVEYSSDNEEIDPTNLEFSENEESSQEEYSDSD
ncbi:hypothetical protein Tco_1270540, partial [Tanacetum coccineum]